MLAISIEIIYLEKRLYVVADILAMGILIYFFSQKIFTFELQKYMYDRDLTLRLIIYR
jgi:hypothetical protein